MAQNETINDPNLDYWTVELGVSYNHLLGAVAMTSANQKRWLIDLLADDEVLEKRIFSIPTPEDIHDTAEMIEGILTIPRMGLPENADILDGFNEAIVILTEGKRFYDEIDVRLTSPKSRIIARAAVDYISGRCDQRDLLKHLRK